MSIRAEHLTKIYGTQKAVEDISFTVEKGELTGFLGPNGAGKSTTMKILTGCLSASTGRAEICGFDVETSSLEARRRIGYLPESNPLYPEMYVGEYLLFHASIHGLGKRSASRISEMIWLTGLEPERKKKIGELSKGYRQRVGLAQALLHDPEVLVLDEPTSGLDPNQLAEIRTLIRNLSREKTVLLSTHIMQEVQALCDRVIILSRGKIVADSAMNKLQEQSKGTHILQVEFSGVLSIGVLAAIPGVSAVQQDSPGKWTLTTLDADLVRKNLLQFALQNNLNILSLQSNSRSLEDIFRQLTEDPLP